MACKLSTHDYSGGSVPGDVLSLPTAMQLIPPPFHPQPKCRLPVAPPALLLCCNDPFVVECSASLPTGAAPQFPAFCRLEGEVNILLTMPWRLQHRLDARHALWSLSSSPSSATGTRHCRALHANTDRHRHINGLRCAVMRPSPAAAYQDRAGTACTNVHLGSVATLGAELLAELDRHLHRLRRRRRRKCRRGTPRRRQQPGVREVVAVEDSQPAQLGAVGYCRQPAAGQARASIHLWRVTFTIVNGEVHCGNLSRAAQRYCVSRRSCEKTQLREPARHHSKRKEAVCMLTEPVPGTSGQSGSCTGSAERRS